MASAITSKVLKKSDLAYFRDTKNKGQFLNMFRISKRLMISLCSKSQIA
jgi:hypothetical protein